MHKWLPLMLVVAVFAFTIPATAETVDPTVAPTAAAFSGETPEALLQQWYQIGALLRANGTYPFTELEKGDEGYEVTALQTRLSELGYYQKEIVDHFGGGTFSALKAFEKNNGLKVNGIASVADQKVLFGSDAVADTGTKVGVSKDNGGVDATSGATGE